MNLNRNISSGLSLTIISLLVLTSPGKANDLGGRAGAFLRVGLGADRVAMGDCGAALTGGGMNWYYNPAGISSQVSRQAAIGYRNMSLDRSIMYAGYSMPLQPNAGLAFGALRAGTGNIDARDSNGEPLDVMSHSENLIHGSFALTPTPIVSLGISIKWFINAIPDVKEDNKNLYAYAMGIDLGLRLQPVERLSLGLQVRDLGANYSWETSEVWGDQTTKDEELPSLLRIGAAYDILDQATIALDLVVNTNRIGDESDAIEPRFGGEFRRDIGDGRSVALRAGWNGSAPTFGFGLGFDLVGVRARMDYAFLVEQVSPGGSHLIGWVIEF